ncbi:hypothetical protein [uncultured Roseibium sp.]|uniref:hypothetical protein n=1 Tax=uncultured Roseibium sp. TaxID=1936171 RepID=UPI002635F623|nr:hypothetical protein [uncultured Roseibium sp.]
MIAQTVIALASVLALFALAAFIRKVSDKFFLSAESQRKAVHVGVGLHAMLLPLLLTREGFLVFAVFSALALLVLRIPGIASEGVGASLHSVQRRSWGDFLFLLAVSLLFVLSAGHPALYVLPIAVLTLSDAAAALVGTEYGRMRFGGEDRIKSVEGSATFFVVTWMTAVTILLLATDIPRQNVILLSTLVAMFSTYVEAASWRGLDNLFVPVGIYVLLFTWADSPTMVLAAITLGWLLFLIIVQFAAPLVGMSPHAARSASVAMFLTVVVVSPMNAVLPLLAFLAVLLSRPSGDDTELILDFVATLILTGVAWLITGTLFGINAIAFYSGSFVAIGVGYACYAYRGSRFQFLSGIVAAAVALPAYWLLLPDMNQFTGWVPQLPIVAVVSLVTIVAAISEVVRPRHWNSTAPGFRFSVIALVLLLPVYVYEVLN